MRLETEMDLQMDLRMVKPRLKGSETDLPKEMRTVKWKHLEID